LNTLLGFALERKQANHSANTCSDWPP
jgi:hypothetical protein